MTRRTPISDEGPCRPTIWIRRTSPEFSVSTVDQAHGLTALLAQRLCAKLRWRQDRLRDIACNVVPVVALSDLRRSCPLEINLFPAFSADRSESHFPAGTGECASHHVRELGPIDQFDVELPRVLDSELRVNSGRDEKRAVSVCFLHRREQNLKLSSPDLLVWRVALALENVLLPILLQYGVLSLVARVWGLRYFVPKLAKHLGDGILELARAKLQAPICLGEPLLHKPPYFRQANLECSRSELRSARFGVLLRTKLRDLGFAFACAVRALASLRASGNSVGTRPPSFLYRFAGRSEFGVGNRDEDPDSEARGDEGNRPTASARRVDVAHE